MQVPFILDAEYRGVRPGGSYTDRETGQERPYDPKLKFEVELPDGDVSTLELRAGDIDSLVDYDALKSLKKGDSVKVAGMIRESRFGLQIDLASFERKGGKPVAATA